MDRSWVHARKRDYEGLECGEQGGIHRGRGELDGTKWYIGRTFAFCVLSF